MRFDHGERNRDITTATAFRFACQRQSYNVRQMKTAIFILRLLIPTLLISICVAPLAAHPVTSYEPFWCSLPSAQPQSMKNYFPRPILFQQMPIAVFREDGTILKHITPPPEFLAHDSTMHPGGLCPLSHSIGCYGSCVHVDEKGRNH